jgi:hypothetical protein
MKAIVPLNGQHVEVPSGRHRARVPDGNLYELASRNAVQASLCADGLQ